MARKNKLSLFMVLALEKRRMRQVDALNRVKFMLGTHFRKASFLEKKHGVIDQLHTLNIIERTIQGQGSSKETLIRLDPGLSDRYINNIMFQAARFFGFKSVYGGLIKEDPISPHRVYCRVRNSYSKLSDSRFFYKIRNEAIRSEVISQTIRPLNTFLGDDEKGSPTREARPWQELNSIGSMFGKH